jgi:hypothetical protein
MLDVGGALASRVDGHYDAATFKTPSSAATHDVVAGGGAAASSTIGSAVVGADARSVALRFSQAHMLSKWPNSVASTSGDSSFSSSSSSGVGVTPTRPNSPSSPGNYLRSSRAYTSSNNPSNGGVSISNSTATQLNKSTSAPIHRQDVLSSVQRSLSLASVAGFETGAATSTTASASAGSAVVVIPHSLSSMPHSSSASAALAPLRTPSHSQICVKYMGTIGGDWPTVQVHGLLWCNSLTNLCLCVCLLIKIPVHSLPILYIVLHCFLNFTCLISHISYLCVCVSAGSLVS